MNAEGGSQKVESNSYMMSSQTTSGETAITLMQQKLPQYIQNIFKACGYDTLQVIAEMNVDQSSEYNDIDKMLEYVKKTFPNDNRYALQYTNVDVELLYKLHVVAHLYENSSWLHPNWECIYSCCLIAG